jgi:hypothetical protein
MDDARHDHVLPDGTTVLIRPITPEDAPLLLGMWDRTSIESRRARFLGTFNLDETNVHRFTDLDPSLQYGIVATRGRGRARGSSASPATSATPRTAHTPSSPRSSRTATRVAGSGPRSSDRSLRPRRTPVSGR